MSKEGFLWYMEYNTNAIKDVLDRIDPIRVKIADPVELIHMSAVDAYQLRNALNEIKVLTDMAWHDIQTERRYQEVEKPLWKRILKRK